MTYNDEGLPIIPPTEPAPQRPADGAVAICGLCGLRIMPVMGYVCSNPRCGVFPQVTCVTGGLYASQPKRQPLTAQQLDRLIEGHVGGAELADGEYSAMVLFAAAVERAHGISEP